MDSDSSASDQNDLPRLAEVLLSEAERIREFVLIAEEDGFLALSRSLARISNVGIAMTRLGIQDHTRPISQAMIDLVRERVLFRSFPDYESKMHNLEVQFLERGLALLDDVISRLSRWIDRKGTTCGGELPADDGETPHCPGGGDIVMLNPPQVIIDGNAYAVESDHAIYLTAIHDADDWMSDSEFKQQYPEFGDNVRPDLWRRRLPKKVKALIETTHRGTRWRHEK